MFIYFCVIIAKNIKYLAIPIISAQDETAGVSGLLEKSKLDYLKFCSQATQIASPNIFSLGSQNHHKSLLKVDTLPAPKS